MANSQKTLLVLGDSISAAYGINSNQGWVHLLQQRLSEQDYRYRVINASISGDTTQNGLSRLPQLQEKYQPDIIIIALGANDGLRGLPLSEVNKNLNRLISSSLKHNSQVVLAGIRMPPNYGTAFNHHFASIYQQLADTWGIPLVTRLLNQVADHSHLMQADGMHPTAEAQMQILENVWPKLKPILK